MLKFAFFWPEIRSRNFVKEYKIIVEDKTLVSNILKIQTIIKLNAEVIVFSIRCTQ